jgi:hypothetical protein
MHTLKPEFSFAGFTFPRYIADLPIGKPAMKKKREQRKYTGGYYHAPKPTGSGGWGFYDGPDGSGRSFEMRIERTGDSYYCDLDGHQEMHAIIARLNHGRGFLVGWSMGDGMCASLDDDIHTEEDDARRVANTRTRDAADREAEYQAEEQARIDAEDLEGDEE